MKFELYNSASEWRWRLKSGNGEVVASGEGYTTKQNAQNAIGLVMDTSRQTESVEV